MSLTVCLSPTDTLQYPQRDGYLWVVESDLRAALPAGP
jgi:hypothetical protein